MSTYGYEVSRAKRSNRPVRGSPPSSDGRGSRGRKVGGRKPETILSQPGNRNFTCGDTRLLVVYYYFERSPRRLKPEQMEFKLKIDAHLCAPLSDSKSVGGCMCVKVLELVNRYVDLWWREEGLLSVERVSTLDSDRITDDEIYMIAGAIDGWL